MMTRGFIYCAAIIILFSGCKMTKTFWRGVTAEADDHIIKIVDERIDERVDHFISEKVKTVATDWRTILVGVLSVFGIGGKFGHVLGKNGKGKK